ncbi:hypothetical protein EDD54_3280 [Oharaeibacter diazotrophicus]|uniref:Uncharacterized protein n=1 Tax=Oharaeibacter diazotrophicus TaxID=1920512 RepID=A0A4V3CVP9_9HYPH|nr:hypothetical protein EDD54_3280 [Oharaeibacter diazotrophicus]
MYSDRFRKPQAPSSLFPSAAPTASLRTVGKAGKTLENRGFPSRLVARADRGAAPGARSGPWAVRRAQEAARPGGTPARRLRRSGQEAGFARCRPAIFDAAAPKQDGGSAAAPPRMGSRFGRMRHFAGPRRRPRYSARSTTRRRAPGARTYPKATLERAAFRRSGRRSSDDIGTPAHGARTRLVRPAGTRTGTPSPRCPDRRSGRREIGLSPRTAACPWRPAAAPSSARGSSRRRR